MDVTQIDSVEQKPHKSAFLDELKEKHGIRKVLVAGSGAVGKTSLIRVLKESKSLEELSDQDLEYHRTLFIDMEVIDAGCLGQDAVNGKLQVVDIAGQIDLPIHAVRDAQKVTLGSLDVIVLIFASDNIQSLLDLNEWLELLDSYYDSDPEAKRPEYILVRNKSDLIGSVDEGLIDILRQGNSRITQYFETSCLTGEGLDGLRQWFFKRFFEPKRTQVKEMPAVRSHATGTEFKCMICGEQVTFDIEDESSYDSKTSHEKFFGMQLSTYRVSHIFENERHQNIVLIDHKGLFRGHKDAFSEPLQTQAGLEQREYEVRLEDSALLDDHPYIDLILVFDREECWVVDVLKASGIRPAELAKVIEGRISESERIYEELPEYTTVMIADRELHLWLAGSRVTAAQVKEPCVLTGLAPLARTIVESPDLIGSSKKKAIRLALKVLRHRPSTEPRTMSRLLTDDLLYTSVPTPFQDRIPRIVTRIGKEFPLADDILTPLLRGSTTLMELLETGYYRELREVFDLVDYVNRRGLLG